VSARLGEFQPPEVEEDRDAMWDAWFDQQEKNGMAVLSRDEWKDALNTAAIDGYAEGRNDEREDWEGPLALLRESAATFRRYEALHLAKGTAESAAKALVNGELATRIEAAIESASPVSTAEALDSDETEGAA
jgi:hypothetical protein